jgi:hypothetical protein
MDPNILRAPGAPFWPSYASGGAGNVANGESIGFTVLNITDTAITTSKDGDVSAQCDFGHLTDWMWGTEVQRLASLSYNIHPT